MLMMMEAEENAEELLNLKDVPQKPGKTNDGSRSINTLPKKSDNAHETARE
jgi:hypothetical protein